MPPQHQRHEPCNESWPPMAAMRGRFASCVSRKSWSQVAPRQGESMADADHGCDVFVIVGDLRCTWDTSSLSFTVRHFYCCWCFYWLDVFILDGTSVLLLGCNWARQTHGVWWCHHRNTMPESFWEASWTLCRCHIRAHILRTTLVPFTA